MRTSTKMSPLVALVLLASGCGGGGGAAGQAAECDGKIEGGQVTMFAHEGSEADAYRGAIDKFNQTKGKDLGLTVKLTMIPEGEYTDQVNAAAAAGDLPAVLDIDGPNMANLAWSGHLQSISDCIPGELRDDVLPSLIEQGTYADELYTVGSFDSGLGLWAWRSALQQVGARIPTGWDDAWTADELEQILRSLQKAGYQHPLDTKFWYGSQGEWFSYAFSPILWSAGGDLIDREGYQSAKGALDSDASAKALTTLQTWTTEGLIDADAADDTNFLTKKSPISWVGHWMYQDYHKAAGDDLVLLPLPDFGTGAKTGMGSWSWGITSGATDPDAAWAVIDFLMSDQTILDITGVNGAVPGTASAIEKSELYTEGGPLHLFVEALDAAPDIAVPRPVTPAYPNITQVFRGVVDDVVQGADVTKTLNDAVGKIDADIEDNEGYPAPEK